MSLKIYYQDPHAPKPNFPLTPGISAVITNNQNKILLHRRADHPQWTLPGGKMKLGESISECCHREVTEETGLNVTIEKVVGLYTSPDYVLAFSSDKIFQPFVVAFLCTTRDDSININQESEEAAWFKIENISRLNLLPNTQQIIEHAMTENQTYFD
jgi:mutator protein MutT